MLLIKITLNSLDTADKPPRACLDSEMVGNTQDELLKLILGCYRWWEGQKSSSVIYSPIWNVENGLSCPQPPGVTLFGKLNHFGPQAEQRLGWPLAMARLNCFQPKVKLVATLDIP